MPCSATNVDGSIDAARSALAGDETSCACSQLCGRERRPASEAGDVGPDDTSDDPKHRRLRGCANQERTFIASRLVLTVDGDEPDVPGRPWMAPDRDESNIDATVETASPAAERRSTLHRVDNCCNRSRWTRVADRARKRARTLRPAAATDRGRATGRSTFEHVSLRRRLLGAAHASTVQ